MIPIIQNDYFKYHSMFKGNYLKGVTYLKSLLNAPDTREQIITSMPALAAIFTDFNNNDANRLCYNVLKSKPYFDEAMMNYYRGIEETEYETKEELFDDIVNTLKILRNKDIDLILKKSPFLNEAIRSEKMLWELKKAENTDVLADNDVYASATSYMDYGTTNIYSTYNSSWGTLSGTSTSFAELETFNSISPNYKWMYISEEDELIFIPVMIRTRYNSSSTYYYYPAVFKYDMKTKECKLIHISDTETKQTKIDYNARTALAVAYDYKKKYLYVFYKTMYNSANVYYDIVDVVNETTVVNKALLSSVGDTTFQEAYFCRYDDEIDAVRFAWQVGNIYIGSSSTYGYIYGATLNETEILWSGKAVHPAAENTAPNSSYTTVMSNREYLRYKDGAIVSVYQKGSNSNDYPSIIVILKTDGIKMKGKYVSTVSKATYSHIASPSYCGILNNGLVWLHWKNIYYGGSNYRYPAMLIDLGKTSPTCLENKDTTDSAISYYPSYFFDKLLMKESSETSMKGINASRSLIASSGKSITSAFNVTAGLEYKGSNRYRAYLPNATTWTIYDCERRLH